MKTAITPIVVLVIVLGCAAVNTVAHGSNSCSEATPNYQIDLSQNSDSIWTSASDLVRGGNCCGGSNSENCISFSLELHADVSLINFEIIDGALPNGSMRYRVDCGHPVRVGNAVCVAGKQHVEVVFCKPGNNANQYRITCIPKPQVPAIDTVQQMDQHLLITRGLIPESVFWMGLNAHPTGNVLDCLSTCDSLLLLASGAVNSTASYMVCGWTPHNVCTSPQLFCDSVSFYIVEDLGGEQGTDTTDQQTEPVVDTVAIVDTIVAPVVMDSTLADTGILVTEEPSDEVTDEDQSDVVVPNAFTPNGDGVNDFFDIKGLAVSDIKAQYIYSRYGKLLHQSSNPKGPWNGEFNGKMAPSGTYVYLISLHNSSATLSGTVTIVY